MSAVLGVIYLVFNEGYSATSGEDLIRPELCEDALRPGRMLAELVPLEAEVHGLVALMELQASRSPARVDGEGEPVLLLAQNRARWDRLLIERGLVALAHAEALSQVAGPYAIQAAIAACHVRAHAAEEMAWPRIAQLYDALVQVNSTPIVRLNRAVAVAMAFGPADGLALVEVLSDEPTLHADLLAKLGRLEEASAEFRRAALLTQNAKQRAQLLERAGACARGLWPS
jgi:predicted RNA polymerase sigma factor